MIPTVVPTLDPTVIPSIVPILGRGSLARAAVGPAPTEFTIDIRPAIAALLADRKLPDRDVVSVAAAAAYAVARCSGGRAQLLGGSQVSGVKVLGRDVALDGAFEETVQLVDPATLDLSQLDLSAIALPAGLSLSTPTVGPLLEAAIRDALDALPALEIPATFAQVNLIPGAQTRGVNRLTQNALRANVSVFGQPLIDAVIGEASVAEDDVDCRMPEHDAKASESAGGADAAGLALECTKRRLVLTDITPGRTRVKLQGVADRELAGRTVDITFGSTDKRIARAKVRADGTFTASAKLPPRALRNTNRARYQARIGKERSRDLKLTRRMTVDSMKAADGKVVIKGRLLGPLPGKRFPIVVKRRISCKKSEKVAVILPRKNGSFRVVVDAPEGRNAAVFRLSGRVQRTSRNSKTFPTYTLPHGVNLV